MYACQHNLLYLTDYLYCPLGNEVSELCYLEIVNMGQIKKSDPWGKKHAPIVSSNMGRIRD